MSDMLRDTVSVLDFRRRRMAVQWNVATGEWSSHEEAPELVHGVALIRPTADNVCLYGRGGRLILQIGRRPFVLDSDGGISVHCGGMALSLGLRREVTVRSRNGEALFQHRYWVESHTDFFKLLADRTASADWRESSAQTWSDGVLSTALRESWAR